LILAETGLTVLVLLTCGLRPAGKLNRLAGAISRKTPLDAREKLIGAIIASPFQVPEVLVRMAVTLFSRGAGCMNVAFHLRNEQYANV